MNDASSTEVPSESGVTPRDASRRSLFSWLAVGGALAASYGTLAAFVGRFIYPQASARQWFFVLQSRELGLGESRVFKTPGGEPVNVTRRQDDDGSETVAALSSTCPHLGCQVHWEGHNNRFFCPCHNGVFDPNGIATGGPPADAGQSLLQFPLKEENGLLYIELPVDRVAGRSDRLEPAPDPSSEFGPACRPCESEGTRA